MKPIVTLSLLLLSMTQLSRAERIVGLRLLSEQYSNRPQRNNALSILDFSQQDNQRNLFLLNHIELSLSGSIQEIQHERHQPVNELVYSLTVREKPKNNSP